MRISPASATRRCGLRVVSLCVVGMISVLIACGESSRLATPGGLYSVWEGENGFGVVKVLAVEPEAVSIRWYRETFADRPSDITSQDLSLGSIDDAEFGLGHIPVTWRDFKLMFPVLITTEELTEEELDGYRIWKEAGSAVFSFDEMPTLPAGADSVIEESGTSHEETEQGVGEGRPE